MNIIVFIKVIGFIGVAAVVQFVSRAMAFIIGIAAVVAFVVINLCSCYLWMSYFYHCSG